MKVRVLFVCILIIGLSACQPEAVKEVAYLTIQGKTMGTTYTVKYKDSLERDFKAAIDQLLLEINADVSTYEPESFITRFNKSEIEIPYLNILKPETKSPKHFKVNFEKSKEIFENSLGYFDPTIMPIVNYWGFGYTEKKAVEEADKVIVDSLMKFVGFEKIEQRSAKDGWIYLQKASKGVQLDFSAIAKGYAVDEVAQLLKGKNIQNYYVEIGGELAVQGKNPSQEWWTIGINTPKTDAAVTDIEAKVSLHNCAMATSGNYRIFYEVKGVKYAHTINSKTGFPEKNMLLSTTIFAPDCMTADGYATACMSMGLEKAKTMINKIKDVDAYFLYSDEAGSILAHSTNPNLKIDKRE